MSTESRMGHDPLAWLSAEAPDAEMPPTPHADLLAPEALDEPVAKAGDGPFGLGEELVIARAEELSKELKVLLERKVDMRLDGGAVERADGAGLQLLVAFFKAAAAQGIRVEWAASSDTLSEAASLAGLESHLSLDGGSGA